jgi:hypothetical protein
VIIKRFTVPAGRVLDDDDMDERFGKFELTQSREIKKFKFSIFFRSRVGPASNGSFHVVVDWRTPGLSLDFKRSPPRISLLSALMKPKRSSLGTPKSAASENATSSGIMTKSLLDDPVIIHSNEQLGSMEKLLADHVQAVKEAGGKILTRNQRKVIVEKRKDFASSIFNQVHIRVHSL